ncbi:Rab GTPase [Pelomyxa schiedti]|nr:Rab GTPase [Pelomyxa schiedti]
MAATGGRRVLKIVILGDGGVGKTSLTQRYVLNQFSEKYKATIGADFFSRDLDIGTTPLTLQIWDTAGQERFRSLGSAYYRGSECCVLVFALNILKSFENLETWYTEFVNISAQTNPTAFPFVLVGNKSDLATERAVPQSTIDTWRRAKGGIPYFETSAKNADNVIKIFEAVARSAVVMPPEEAEDKFDTAPVVLQTNNPTPQYECCLSGITGGISKELTAWKNMLP